VFSQIAKRNRRLANVLRRVLIVDPDQARARVTGELLQDALSPQIWAASTSSKAFRLADKIDPDLIVCEFSKEFDGLAFARGLRRSDLRCRKAPIVFVMTTPIASAILAARDAGAHEFLRRPFTLRDLNRRLEAIALQPRAWVEGVDYVGPDRRRFNSAEHEGDLKRIADTGGPPHDVRIAEAIKIIVSALSAIERQPAQSLRALLAQTEELAAVAAEISDAALATGVAELRRYLVEAAKGGGTLNAAEALRRAGVLLNQRGREAA